MPSAQRSRSKQQEQQQQQLSDDDLAPGAPVETLSASQLDNLSIEPVENQDQLPCSVSGFFPALSGGAIGFVFGAGEACTQGNLLAGCLRHTETSTVMVAHPAEAARAQLSWFKSRPTRQCDVTELL